MTVPNNSIVQMPAAAFSWADLFAPATSASVGYTPARTNHGGAVLGLGLQDPINVHFPSYEVRVVGNILPPLVLGGAPRYVVGMILPVSQQGLNGGAGLINFIDYDGTQPSMGNMPGRFRVGGIPNDPTTGAICEINDPVARWGVAHSPDPRFTSDTGNLTITAALGYPVGIPRLGFPTTLINGVNVPDDPLRPLANRPLNMPVSDPFLVLGAFLRTFTMNVTGPALNCDATKQVPLMVGDWVDFSGTLMKIVQAGVNTPANMFMSVHSLTAHLGIQTAPGTDPAYVRVEEFLIGVGPFPLPAGPAAEASNRCVLVAFTTDNNTVNPGVNDSSPGTHINAVVAHSNGQDTEVLFPNGNWNDRANLATGIQIDDPVRGRLRLQLNKNDVNGNVNNNTVAPDNYYREYILRLGTGASRAVPNVANGLTAGQYRLPMFDYIFPEGAVFGEPIPAFNFDQFGFLTTAGHSGRLDGATGPVIGRLDPFPVSTGP
jgi:hypothetical protein